MEDLVGTKLGEYEIVEHIGHGAVADVYKAYQRKLNRYVAIKVLSPIFAEEPTFRERFTREARAIAQLDHPNILPVYDFDQQDDLVYIVMQYVDTGSLADLMGQPLPLDFVLRILEQVGGALAYAHSRGIVHRDIKPGNILLGQGDWALLTDFGLVRMTEGPSDLTPSGMALGTPAYMAPEQVMGAAVDARADIYALGATVYHMVTGRVPYEGEAGMAIAFKHLSEPLVPPHVLNPNLPPAVDRVIVKALAKDRELRYGTVNEFVAAFREALAGISTPRPAEAIATMVGARRPPTPPRAAPTPPQPTPAPVPLEAVWAVQPEEHRYRGSGWAFLAAVVGTLLLFFLLAWGLAMLAGRIP